MIDDILRHNREFVASHSYEKYATSKYPARRMAIVTCMDTRLEGLLPAALGVGCGDVKIIRNAGGVITHPLDSAMRSVLVAVYELGVDTVLVIGHTDCGVCGMQGREMLHLMRERGVSADHIAVMERSGIDLEGWLTGFDDTARAVTSTVDLVRHHPLMPAGVAVEGFIIDTATGALTPVE